MVDIHTLEQAASVIDVGEDEPVIQFPLKLWEAYKAENESKTIENQVTQADQLLALLDEWSTETDDKSPEWWEDFHQFLNGNRLNFTERQSEDQK